MGRREELITNNYLPQLSCRANSIYKPRWGGSALLHEKTTTGRLKNVLGPCITNTQHNKDCLSSLWWGDRSGFRWKKKPTKTYHLAPSLKDPFPLAYICPCYWHWDNPWQQSTSLSWRKAILSHCATNNQKPTSSASLSDLKNKRQFSVLTPRSDLKGKGRRGKTLTIH